MVTMWESRVKLRLERKGERETGRGAVQHSWGSRKEPADLPLLPETNSFHQSVREHPKFPQSLHQWSRTFNGSLALFWDLGNSRFKKPQKYPIPTPFNTGGDASVWLAKASYTTLHYTSGSSCRKRNKGEVGPGAVARLRLHAYWARIQQPVTLHCQHVHAFNKVALKSFNGEPERSLKVSGASTEKGICQLVPCEKNLREPGLLEIHSSICIQTTFCAWNLELKEVPPFKDNVGRISMHQLQLRVQNTSLHVSPQLHHHLGISNSLSPNRGRVGHEWQLLNKGKLSIWRANQHCATRNDFSAYKLLIFSFKMLLDKK